VGAEITGIDVNAGLDERSFNVVRDALHEYCVVVLPGQQLTPQGQIAFTKRFGEMRTSFYNRYGVPGFPELSIVSNILDDKGEAIGIADAGMLWHTDASYLPKPDMYTLLYGVEIPHAEGRPLGDTVFASSTRAFEALPAEMQTRLRGLRAVHSFIDHLEKKRRAGNLKRAPLTEKQKGELPDVLHPVVRTHPVTGRPCLYVTEGHTARIDGLSSEESDALLKQLADQLHNPKFHYRHKWTKGDLLIWDNCSAHHLAIFDYGDTPRRLHRAGVLGPVPV
jgi:taurine dioxygenase